MGKIKTTDQRRAERSARRQKTLQTRDRKGVTKIRKIVRVQQKLLKDVVEQTESELLNKFRARCAPGADPLEAEDLEKFEETYAEDPINQATQNALASVPMSWLAEDRNYLKRINYAYSNLPEHCPRPTYQAQSGRCWLFAALNTIRYGLIERFNLPDHFELSEAYLFFYDKYERAFFFLEKVVELRDRPIHDIVMNGMHTSFSPVTDGGTWTFFVNLITKYGIVPKSCYGENFNSGSTDEMNEVLMDKLAQFSAEIRKSEYADVTLQKRIREVYMPEVYSLLVKFMGKPPQSFTWQYHEAGETFESIRGRGAYRSIPDLTPLTFYGTLIEPDARLSNKVVLRHDPRQTSEYGRTYHVEHFGHMVGGAPDISLNVSWDVLSRTAARSVMSGQQLWFAADVCKMLNMEHGVLSTEAFDYNSVLNTNLDLDKAEGLDTYTSAPSHAMALVGVDVKDQSPDKVIKWKVENSWGSCNGGDDPGYLLMTQEWFRRYGYEVVVDIDMLDDATRTAYEKYQYNPISLPYNDAFGAVARTCKMCRAGGMSRTHTRSVPSQQTE